MAKKQIKLGYYVGTGKEANIDLSHLIVTGITQLSGKTTTLEALVKRGGLKAIIFKTKIGEKSFTQGTQVPPFFRDRSDYEFVKSLIEAYTKEKLYIEKGTLMRLCKGSGSLVEIKRRVDDALAEGKLRGLKEEIHTRLQHYLENLIPQIQYANLSKSLELYDGINIMDLERFTEEAQSLIIHSVADEVLKNQRGIVMVIPEAWKFLPQKYSNPCKRSVESFIRQGAANRNYVWIDSQDMAGVDKGPLKQSSTWILGYQSERNEVKHTLDQVALPKKLKPTEDQVMNLKTGHFLLSSYDGCGEVYVQPAWMDDETALKIATGEIDVMDIETPTNLTPYAVAPRPAPLLANAPAPPSNPPAANFKKDLIELRSDFFNKIAEQQGILTKMQEQIYKLQAMTQQAKPQEPDMEELVSKVLQKMPLSGPRAPEFDREAVIQAVLARIPKGAGVVTYEVAPLEKIKKDFLQAAKESVIGDISGLDDDQKRMLKWIEQRGAHSTKTNIFLNCFGKSATGGSRYQDFSRKVQEMAQLEVIRKDTQQRVFPHLKERISKLVSQYGATDQEVQQVYDHILGEMIK